jgi:hypothetical protein
MHDPVERVRRRTGRDKLHLIKTLRNHQCAPNRILLSPALDLFIFEPNFVISVRDPRPRQHGRWLKKHATNGRSSAWLDGFASQMRGGRTWKHDPMEYPM